MLGHEHLEDLIRTLTIPPDITVEELLTHDSPKAWRQDQQKVMFSEPIDWYRKEQATLGAPRFISHVVLPDPKTCLYISDVLDSAVEEGYQSVAHPYDSNARLPIHFVQLFKRGYNLVRHQQD